MAGLISSLFRRSGSKPGVADSPVSAILIGRTPPKRGLETIADTYRVSPWLRAVLTRLAGSVASTVWTLAQPTRKATRAHPLVRAMRAGPLSVRQTASRSAHKQGLVRAAAPLDEVNDHPVLALLETGNSAFPGDVCLFLTQVWLDLHGEAFWAIQRGPGNQPVAIWPFPPAWVMEFPSPKADTYTLRWSSATAKVPAADVLVFKDPDPANPYGRGIGIVESLADDLDTDRYAASFVKTFFYNGALPSTIVNFPKLSKEQLAATKAGWETAHRGVQNSHRVSFLNGDSVDVKQLDTAFKDLGMVELRKHERDTIISVFGVPPEVLGIVENSNRATITEAFTLFALLCTVPRVERIRQVLQTKLLPMFGADLILDYVSPVPEDQQERRAWATANPSTITRGEWRELQGFESHGKSDDVYLQGFAVLERPVNGAAVEAAEPLEIVDEEGVEIVDGPADGAEADAGRAIVKRAGPALTDEQIAKLLAALEPETLANPVSVLFKDRIGEWGTDVLKDLGLPGSFDLLDPVVVAYLDKLAGEKITGINDTTKSALRDTLEAGAREGESIKELAKRVASTFEDAAGYRSVMIARTECGGASNFGTYTAYDQSGVVENKQWVATPDDRTRDSHASIDGQIKPLHDPFVLGDGVEALYPGSSGVADADINCRCTTVAVIGGRSFDVEQRAAVWRSWDSKVRSWERATIQVLQRAFAEQRASVLAELGAVVGG